MGAGREGTVRLERRLAGKVGVEAGDLPAAWLRTRIETDILDDGAADHDGGDVESHPARNRRHVEAGQPVDQAFGGGADIDRLRRPLAERAVEVELAGG